MVPDRQASLPNAVTGKTDNQSPSHGNSTGIGSEASWLGLKISKEKITPSIKYTKMKI